MEYTLARIWAKIERTPTMTKSQPRYLSYLLRLWQTGRNPAWRASLDSVNGERMGFASLEALLTFLREQTELEEEVRLDSNETHLKDQKIL
jgi:hypothetical protein